MHVHIRGRQFRAPPRQILIGYFLFLAGTAPRLFLLLAPRRCTFSRSFSRRHRVSSAQRFRLRPPPDPDPLPVVPAPRNSRTRTWTFPTTTTTTLVAPGLQLLLSTIITCCDCVTFITYYTLLIVLSKKESLKRVIFS